MKTTFGLTFSECLIIIWCRLTQKIANLVKTHINIKRELPVAKASRIFSGRSGHLGRVASSGRSGPSLKNGRW